MSRTLIVTYNLATITSLKTTDELTMSSILKMTTFALITMIIPKLTNNNTHHLYKTTKNFQPLLVTNNLSYL